MREIVFDTETTGLSATDGHRLIEIGCVELLNRIPTGRFYHTYVNPERLVDPEAIRVHGLDDAFLADKPLFSAVCERFLDFVADSVLVAHNAGFDEGFINMELQRCSRAVFETARFIDTLTLARRRHPGAQNSLDALCGRYGIDNSRRTKHGALLDAEILAEVYIELCGGRQAALELDSGTGLLVTDAARPLPKRPAPLGPLISEDDAARHAAMVADLGEAALWRRFAPYQS